MKNNYNYILALLLMSFSFIKGFSQESMTSTGGNAKGSNGTATYSIGQVMFKSYLGTNEYIGTGVQQPYEILTLENNDFSKNNVSLSIYPNPISDVLHLVVNDDIWYDMMYQLFDIDGKALSKKQKIMAAETNVPMQEFGNGIYLIIITNDVKTIKTFKIIKKQ